VTALLSIVGLTTPFFALVLCGWFATWRGWVPLDAIPGLNVFVLWFALPCMLFRFAAATPIAQLLDPVVVALWLGCATVLVAIAVIASRRQALGWNDASFVALVTTFPNSGFLGVPLLVALIGASAAPPAIVALSLDMVITSSACIALSRAGIVRSDGGPGASAAWRGVLTNPLAWAIVLGGTMSATGAVLPGPGMRAVSMLADAASPTALFTLGGFLARPRRSAQAASRLATADRSVPIAVGAKLVVHPLLLFAAGTAAIAAGAPLEPAAATVLVLVAALPAASNVPLLAERFGADAGRVARIVFFTTLGAFFTFAVTAALVGVQPPTQG
jgi:hypothetical protein